MMATQTERQALDAAIDLTAEQLLHSGGRLNPRQDFVGNFAGVAHACVGVELHPLGNAPLGEIVRVNVYAHDPQAFDLVSFAAGFGCAQPLIVGPMEFVTVIEHGAQPLEMLRLEPRHTHGLHLVDHAATPDSDDAAMVVEVPQ